MPRAWARAWCSCADDALSPGRPGDAPARAGRTLGLVEVTITGLGTGAERSSVIAARSESELREMRARRNAGGAGDFEPQSVALPRNADATGDGTIQLELISTGSFTDGRRSEEGYRYLWATYAVRNAQGDGTPYDTPRRNLTFYAVDTEGTIGETAVLAMERFDGNGADPAIATRLVPTGAVHRDQATGEVVVTTSDVVQLLTEDEANAIQALAEPELGIVDVFPYGFVVRRLGNTATRELPANPDADAFDGIVTFAFKVPLQSSPADDPFTISLVFLVVDDDEVKLTQTIEEQTPAGRESFDARAAALGADILTLLAPAGDEAPQGGASVRLLCDVRVAGPQGNPEATLSSASEAWPLSSVSRSGSRFLPQDGRVAAARCPELVAPGPATFAVHGFQSGRNLAGAYSGAGGPLVRAPAGRGGSYFPGEEVEVTLTTALGGTKPVVARYRVAATAGSGTFGDGVTYVVGNWPVSVAVGDVDGDGDLDIVVANSAGFLNPSHTASVYLNK